MGPWPKFINNYLFLLIHLRPSGYGGLIQPTERNFVSLVSFWASLRGGEENMLNNIKSATGGKQIAIGMVCLLFLALAFPVLGKEQSKKPANASPVLEKITFVHYAKGAKNIPPIADDSNDRFKLLYGGIRWASAMTYEVNLSASGFNSPTEKGQAMAALSASLETWDDAITGKFELFDVLAPTTETLVGGDVPDYINRIVWQDLGDSGVIAYNSFWFNRAEKKIVESDVVFNSDYDWSLDCGDEDCESAGSEKMDLQNIATHEFGHNGLGDLYSPPTTALTMYGYSSEGEIDKRDLGTGDINGIQALYGP